MTSKSPLSHVLENVFALQHNSLFPRLFGKEMMAFRAQQHKEHRFKTNHILTWQRDPIIHFSIFCNNSIIIPCQFGYNTLRHFQWFVYCSEYGPARITYWQISNWITVGECFTCRPSYTVQMQGHSSRHVRARSSRCHNRCPACERGVNRMANTIASNYFICAHPLSHLDFDPYSRLLPIKVSQAQQAQVTQTRAKNSKLLC